MLKNLANRRSATAIAAASVAAMLVVAACGGGEDRPGVTVIGGGSVSVSGTGAGAGPSRGGDLYRPVSDVEGQLVLAEDIRDVIALLAPAREGRPVDWKAVAEIYEKGRNSRKSDGSLRSLRAAAQEAGVLAQFPNGAAVFGTPSFLDALLRAGLDGAGRGQGLSDQARGELVKKGSLTILYGKVLQELQAAREKAVQGKTDPAGAPHNVDEAWAFYVGAQDSTGARPHALAATALKWESKAGAAGRLDQKIQEELREAQEAAGRGDLGKFDGEVAEIRERLQTLFYLATLGELNDAVADTAPGPRQVHLAEGWAFYQAIRPVVAGVSSSRAASVEAVLARDGSRAVSRKDAEQVQGALNAPEVLKALGVPDDLVQSLPSR